MIQDPWSTVDFCEMCVRMVWWYAWFGFVRAYKQHSMRSIIHDESRSMIDSLVFVSGRTALSEIHDPWSMIDSYEFGLPRRPLIYDRFPYKFDFLADPWSADFLSDPWSVIDSYKCWLSRRSLIRDGVIRISIASQILDLWSIPASFHDCLTDPWSMIDPYEFDCRSSMIRHGFLRESWLHCRSLICDRFLRLWLQIIYDRWSTYDIFFSCRSLICDRFLRVLIASQIHDPWWSDRFLGVWLPRRPAVRCRCVVDCGRLIESFTCCSRFLHGGCTWLEPMPIYPRALPPSLALSVCLSDWLAGWWFSGFLDNLCIDLSVKNLDAQARGAVGLVPGSGWTDTAAGGSVVVAGLVWRRPAAERTGFRGRKGLVNCVVVGDFPIGQMWNGMFLIGQLCQRRFLFGRLCYRRFLTGHLYHRRFSTGQLCNRRFLSGQLYHTYISYVGDFWLFNWVRRDFWLANCITDFLLVKCVTQQEISDRSIASYILVRRRFLIGQLCQRRFLIGQVYHRRFLIGQLYHTRFLIGQSCHRRFLMGQLCLWWGDFWLVDRIIHMRTRFVIGILCHRIFLIGQLYHWTFLIGHFCHRSFLIGQLCHARFMIGQFCHKRFIIGQLCNRTFLIGITGCFWSLVETAWMTRFTSPKVASLSVRCLFSRDCRSRSFVTIGPFFLQEISDLWKRRTRNPFLSARILIRS